MLLLLLSVRGFHLTCPQRSESPVWITDARMEDSVKRATTAPYTCRCLEGFEGNFCEAEKIVDGGDAGLGTWVTNLK